MNRVNTQKRKFLPLLALAVLVAGTIFPALSQQEVHAGQIENRSLTLMAGTVDTDGDGINDGGSMPGGTVSHMMAFDVPSTTTDIGSIKFQYCTTAASVAGGVDCDLPTGMDSTGAVLGNESGDTGYSVSDATTNGTVVISKTSAAAPPVASLSYQLDNIVNPTTTNETFFVRITTYGTLDASGSEVDSGTVTASTATPIELEGTMPESLVFCTGEVIGLTDGVPDCNTATDGIIAFNQLFSPTSTATATSQMAASTNAGQGYSITVNGPTMTSGSNTIDAMATLDTSKKGVSQFGINLKDNTTASSDPAVGTEVTPASNGTNYNGQAGTGYATIDSFKFVGGDSVANSGGGSTDSQIFTASYIVNVPGSQPAGTYNTTLTYICTATF